MAWTLGSLKTGWYFTSLVSTFYAKLNKLLIKIIINIIYLTLPARRCLQKETQSIEPALRNKINYMFLNNNIMSPKRDIDLTSK